MAGLPDITLEDTKRGVSMEDLREELDAVLSDGDKKVLYYFFLKNDCMNLVKLLKNPHAEIDLNGNLTMEQYVDLMTSAREMNFNVHRYPAFMSMFAREYAYNKDKEGYFPEDDMLYKFYQYAIETCPNKTVRQWFKLNLDMGTVIENGEDLSILYDKPEIINHVHISEPYLEPVTKRKIHEGLRVLLDKVNYGGYVSIEMKKQDDLSKVKQVMEYVSDLFGKSDKDDI